jgi:hypothetical protein
VSDVAFDRLREEVGSDIGVISVGTVGVDSKNSSKLGFVTIGTAASVAIEL